MVINAKKVTGKTRQPFNLVNHNYAVANTLLVALYKNEVHICLLANRAGDGALTSFI